MLSAECHAAFQIQHSAWKSAAAAGRKPNSVPRLGPCGLRRGDDHSSSPVITDGIKRPTRRLRTGSPGNASLFGLAPCGVLPATRVATSAVRSYRTFSPLPRLRALPALRRRQAPRSCPLRASGRACLAPKRPKDAKAKAVYFLCHYPSGYPDRALPGALPCGVRTFLPRLRALRARRARISIRPSSLSELKLRATAVRRTRSGDCLACCGGIPIRLPPG